MKHGTIGLLWKSRPAPRVGPSRIVRGNEGKTGAATKANTLNSKGLGIKRVLQGICKSWRDEAGQDIAEYAVMLAVILIIVIGTVKLIGSNANSTFSNVASSVQ